MIPGVRRAGPPFQAEHEADIASPERATEDRPRRSLTGERVASSIAFGEAVRVGDVVSHHLQAPGSVVERQTCAEVAVTGQRGGVGYVDIALPDIVIAAIDAQLVSVAHGEIQAGTDIAVDLGMAHDLLAECIAGIGSGRAGEIDVVGILHRERAGDRQGASDPQKTVSLDALVFG
jgi:hypothetical protein